VVRERREGGRGETEREEEREMKEVGGRRDEGSGVVEREEG
jgi:hypothetical protein